MLGIVIILRNGNIEVGKTVPELLVNVILLDEKDRLGKADTVGSGKGCLGIEVVNAVSVIETRMTFLFFDDSREKGLTGIESGVKGVGEGTLTGGINNVHTVDISIGIVAVDMVLQELTERLADDDTLLVGILPDGKILEKGCLDGMVDIDTVKETYLLQDGQAKVRRTTEMLACFVDTGIEGDT